jgi:hypothetical protein
MDLHRERVVGRLSSERKKIMQDLSAVAGGCGFSISSPPPGAQRHGGDLAKSSRVLSRDVDVMLELQGFTAMQRLKSHTAQENAF